jgi:hypothetical protein
MKLSTFADDIVIFSFMGAFSGHVKMKKVSFSPSLPPLFENLTIKNLQ